MFAIGYYAHATDAIAGAPRLNETLWDSLASDLPETRNIELVEFVDIECPSCRMMESVVAELTASAGIHRVTRSFPLQYHRNAYRGALLAACGSRLGQTELSSGSIIRALRPLRDTVQVEKALVDYAASCEVSRADSLAVVRDIELGKAISLRGTPTYVVDGYMIGIADSSRLTAVLSQRGSVTRRVLHHLVSLF